MIVIIEYSMGNLDSVVRAFRKIGAEVRVSADPAVVAEASGLVLPGVGAYAEAMRAISERGLAEPLRRRVLEEKRPVLGICLGFQIMTSHGEEGDADGLGWLGGATRRFRFDPESAMKIPHMGWNDLSPVKESPLTEGIDPRACFYFAHSYHVTDTVPGSVLATSEYGGGFVSAAAHGNIFGTQFHPEKSYGAGLRLLRNFAEMAAHA